MRCWRCGAEVQDGSPFCGNCGASLRGDQTPPSDGRNGQYGGPYNGGMGGGRNEWSSGNGSEILLRIFASVCAVSYGGRALLRLLNLVRSLIFAHMSWFTSLRVVLFGGLSVLLGAWMCLVLVMLAFRRNQRNSDGLLLCLGGGAAGLIILRVLSLLVNVVVYPGAFSSQLQALLSTVLGAAVAVGGVCLIIRFVLGELPFAGKGPEDMGDALREAFSSLGQAAGEAGAQAAQAAQEAQAQREARQQAQQNAYGQNPPPGYGPFRLKTDRNLLIYLLLCLVTCGFYHWYMIYSLAQDVNAACRGDGQNTPGLLPFILLSLVTCGIYSLYWYYSVGNRLFNNSPRYGLNIQESGTTILLWLVVGLLLCGLGSLVGLHLLFRNANAICTAYNYQNGY